MYIGYLARVYISRLSSSDDDGSWIIEGLAIYIHSNILSLMLAWKREGFHPEHDFYETSRDGSIIDWSSMHGTPAEEYLFPHTASVYEMLDMELNQALVSFLLIKKYLRHFPEYIPTCVGLSKKIKRYLKIWKYKMLFWKSGWNLSFSRLCCQSSISFKRSVGPCNARSLEPIIHATTLARADIRS